jgi:hypothetical protein
MLSSLSAPPSQGITAENSNRKRSSFVVSEQPGRDSWYQAVETIPFLKHRRFNPELVDSMSVAYASVCQALGLSTESDRKKIESVAVKIIEIAALGARSPTTIHTLAMEELGDAK